jgi:cob(I)alamin adenosyltransferase
MLIITKFMVSEAPREYKIIRGEYMEGKVHLYTGDGKGKTTAAVGLAVRALGRGLSVAFWQFLKPGGNSGEELALGRFTNLKWQAFGRKGFIGAKGPNEEDRRLAHLACEGALRDINSGRFDLVVLDEITLVCHLGIIPPSKVVAGILGRASTVEIVLTGRNAPPELWEVADYITEMKCHRHPFDAGLGAREGVEF